MNADNSNFGPPPLATPITTDTPDETGVPFQSRGLPSGNLNVGWAAWFNKLSALVRILLSISGTTVYVSMFPGADIGEQINNAYAALPAGGGEIILDISGSFTTPVVFGVANKVAILRGFGNSTTVTYTANAGTAITFDNGNAFDFASGMAGITLTGHGNTTTAIGVLIGGVTNGAVGFEMRNCKIQSFGVNLKTASQTWLQKYDQCMFRDGGANVLLPSGQTNAGENISFDHCVFADAPAPHTNSVWVQGGGQEVVFNSCSFDQAQVRIGNGATSAAQVSLAGCHFENPNFAVLGSVDYDYLVVDNHPGNYVRVTDCYMLQDRTAGAAYPRFMVLQGGVINVIGMGMFTPAGVPLGNFAVLSNAVNVNLFAFNDLSGNITGTLWGGATTGFVNSLPGASTSTASGYNSIVGPADTLGGAAVQFGVDVAVGTGASPKDLTVNGDAFVANSVHAAGYIAAGVPGITAASPRVSAVAAPTGAFLTSISVSTSTISYTPGASTATFVDGVGSAAASAVTAVTPTIAADQFTEGLRTA